ncbi:hypothetical protein Cabther_B0442 [Chloracidobacterium thermophilum B]|uniref:Uncharacterized protein n=1 Tax=Chloracidobacterium thermophilum (strain B) TaxID=981222 RepID=G2LLG8_CHLTF|nr:hypothetical protein Cabther_B0442 [Chloracidobacterium thermophilum B]
MGIGLQYLIEQLPAGVFVTGFDSRNGLFESV